MDYFVENNMTPTAQELLNDPKFLRKRIKEQDEYIQNYQLWYRGLELDSEQFGVPSTTWRIQRKVEVVTSAQYLRAFFVLLLQHLERNKQK